jgi:beta-barrel assembly-enhancing protease
LGIGGSFPGAKRPTPSAELRKGREPMFRSVKYLPALLAVIVSAGVALGPRPASAALGLISRSEEIRMGQEAAAQIESKYPTRRDRRVEGIGMDIVRANDMPDYPYRFRVIERDEVNAISLPGGPVYVYRGLLRMVGDDDDALAGVIAHELGHIKERHSVDQMEKQGLASLLIGNLARGRAQPFAGILANVGLLRFSRGDEYEADDEGAVMMARAGYNPNGLVRFFQRLQRVEGRGSGSISWLRTHPTSTQRIRRLQGRVDNLERRMR